MPFLSSSGADTAKENYNSPRSMTESVQLCSRVGPHVPSVKKPISIGSLQTQLESQIREHVAKYYEGWTVCDDGHRTRKMGVWGRRCLQQNCRGKVTFEYSDGRLYNQLRFYASLFNAEKVLKGTVGSTQTDAVAAVVSSNLALLQAMSACVEKYLDQSARRWVELSTIFSFMNV